MPYRASAQFQRLEVTSDNWISQVGQEAVRVVTIIESSPIRIIDSWRRYRSLGEESSVPLLMMGNGTVLPPAKSDVDSAF
jgi:hypothetical protein